MREFSPNCVLIPYDWIERLDNEPAKMPAFLARVKGLFAAQSVMYATPAVGTPAVKTDADLPLDKPTEALPVSLPTGGGDFHAAFSRRVVAEFPTAIPPLPAQSAILGDAARVFGDDTATAIDTYCTMLAKLAAQNPPEWQRHVRLLVGIVDKPDGYQAIRGEAQAYNNLSTPAKLDADRRRANARLETADGPPPPVLGADTQRDMLRRLTAAVLGGD